MLNALSKLPSSLHLSDALIVEGSEIESEFLFAAATHNAQMRQWLDRALAEVNDSPASDEKTAALAYFDRLKVELAKSEEEICAAIAQTQGRSLRASLGA
jgi:hypothetical protein